ncbi:hypothetical protein HPB52_006145 [Rhipicephalus sanguineus]|uniref:Uncharacterized protein n=1 Tax=Rhipicephalus sanguineus TaxID=34632 RepID=A0A9D4SPV9_RHISA|nr:hypothetical protein HPB52_006145 [Rhipicephalus sanguineus]
MTYGEAFMTDVALSEEPRKWQSRIGYCPQGDALLGKLDAYESLYLIGRLRGVPEKSLPDIVSQIIEITGLQEYAGKRCDYYSSIPICFISIHRRFASAGNKRKLSVAIALIGLPGVVFLDEPYGGVDVLARTRIHKGLTAIKESAKCSISGH